MENRQRFFKRKSVNPSFTERRPKYQKLILPDWSCQRIEIRVFKPEGMYTV